MQSGLVYVCPLGGEEFLEISSQHEWPREGKPTRLFKVIKMTKAEFDDQGYIKETFPENKKILFDWTRNYIANTTLKKKSEQKLAFYYQQ